MPPVSDMTGLPGPVRCAGAAEETGGLEVPVPPQADKRMAAVIDPAPNQRAGIGRLMKVGIDERPNDMQDSVFVMAIILSLLAWSMHRLD
jgi:hypothetical protein